ncbi:hypothetical protein FAEPRAA2165_03170 [Faecalibacterium duncaniae]|uniref:Uncharacterized protein n=1 Tax=Faecalibacterium duncaniae (strain DSM 17677 / JCM 31915 / A2-165) TaxID=411483 RepID=C7HA15_FAED2|nr:hypothetical protein FAEPRAA2165_03170 [Faecalibacterium duncaniae]
MIAADDRAGSFYSIASTAGLPQGQCVDFFIGKPLRRVSNDGEVLVMMERMCIAV